MALKSPHTPISREDFADETQAVRWLNRCHNWDCWKTVCSIGGNRWTVQVRHAGCRLQAQSYYGFVAATQLAHNKLHKAIIKKSPNLRIAK